MEFRFSAEQERIRAEIRAFLHENLPADYEESPVGTEWSGDPDEFGAVCAFLCSKQAGYVSGQTIGVDGAILRGVH